MLRPRTLARAAARARRGPARDRRHRPDGAVGAPRARAGRRSAIRSSATRAPSSPTADGHVAAARADPARARARGDRSSVEAEGYSPNVYVDDELYVAEVTRGRARLRRASSTSRSHPVGDLLDWLSRAADEARLRRRSRTRSTASSRARRRTSATRMYISKSLPYFLEFAAAGRDEGRRARLPRRAHGLHARSRRSRSATARTTSSWSSGPATASRSRTRTTRVKAVADWICPSGRRTKASRRCSKLLV